MDSKHIADQAILICCTIFILATASIVAMGDNLLLRFIQLVSAASLVGGIADWYGVTSIYGRPFGISWKTEIVVKQRKELISGVREFVTQEILSKQNIHDKLAGFQLIKRIISMFKKGNVDGAGPIDWLVNFVSAILWRALSSVDSREVGKYMTNLVSEIVQGNSPSKEIIRAMQSTLSEDFILKFLDTAAPEMDRIASNQGLRDILNETANDAVDSYSSDSWLRSIISDTLKGKIYDAALGSIKDYLQAFATDPNHPDKHMIKGKILSAIDSFYDDPAMQRKVDGFILDWIEAGNIEKTLVAEIDRLKKKDFVTEQGMKAVIGPAAKHFVDNFEEDEAFIEKAEDLLLEWLGSIIEKDHDKIGDFLDANLNQMSDEELVSFIRDNTEKDLQLIRLNGMGFGALVSIVIFAVRLGLGIV